MKSPVSWMGNKTPVLGVLYGMFPLEYERYIEPFGGSGAVLLGKAVPDKFEVLNDYNRNLVNLFRCMRDRPVEFIRALGFLNLNARDDFNVLKKFFRREEFDDAYFQQQLELSEVLLPPIQAQEIRTLYAAAREDYDLRRAVMFLKLIRSSYASGGRSFACQPFSVRSLFGLIQAFSRRCENVIIENQDFEALIRHYDRPTSFFYCDPPYFTSEYVYDCGFTWDDHLRLHRVLTAAQGMLQAHNVAVFFEEQGIHSSQPGAEFYITIYGSIAQSESENISANVRWGKAQSAKAGKIPFQYRRFLGYRKGADDKPEIDPEQAATVRRIYERFLAGDSLTMIAKALTADRIPTPSGIGKWQSGTISSILTNEKYKGDAVLNKTYIADCISKRVMINRGERPKYYVEGNHPAIIDAVTFGRAQEELARRNGKRKVKPDGTKAGPGKYSGKYALTERLVCGECGAPYRRCTWTSRGEKEIVWRCTSRLEYGKRYCHNSPTLAEASLQEAIAAAMQRAAQKNTMLLDTFKQHIRTSLREKSSEEARHGLQIRIAEIQAEFEAMLKSIAASNVDSFDDAKAERLMEEKATLQAQLDGIGEGNQAQDCASDRLNKIYALLGSLKNQPIAYDDAMVRQVVQSVTVENKETIKIMFSGGTEMEQTIA